MNYCVYCRLHPPFRFQHRCFRLVFGRHVVFYVVKYVTWFLEFAFLPLLNFANGPCPSWDRGEMAMALAPRLAPFPSQYVRCCPLSLYSLRSLKLPATTEGGAAERQPLARTQGRNLDRSLTSKPTPCVVCLLTPRGRPRV